MTMRVSQLAKELGVSSKAVRACLADHGVSAISASAPVSAESERLLRSLPPAAFATFSDVDAYAEPSDPWDDAGDVVTAVEAARLCKVRPATIRQWVARGHLSPLPGRRRGKANLYLTETVRLVSTEVRNRTTTPVAPRGGLRSRDLDALVTGAEAAALVGVSASTVRMWVKRGRLARAAGTPRRQLFKVADVLKVARA